MKIDQYKKIQILYDVILEKIDEKENKDQMQYILKYKDIYSQRGVYFPKCTDDIKVETKEFEKSDYFWNNVIWLVITNRKSYDDFLFYIESYSKN